MDYIADPSTLRALKYVSVAAVTGTRLTATDLDAFASAESPRGKDLGEWAESMLRFRRVAMSKYLIEVSWATSTHSGLQLTDLGRAVLEGAADPVDDDASGGFELVVRPDVPLDYFDLLQFVSRFSKALLVDRYFSSDQLKFFLDNLAIERILTCDGAGGSGQIMGCPEEELRERTRARKAPPRSSSAHSEPRETP